MAATIIGPKSIAIPAALGGDDQTFSLALVASVFGLKVESQGDTVRLAGITDWTLLTLQLVGLLLSKGCEVEGYPVSFAISDMDAEVPESFPGRTYQGGTIDEPTEEVHTWNTWVQISPQSPLVIDGVTYVANQRGSDSPMPASVWLNAGLTVVSVPEYQGKQEAAYTAKQEPDVSVQADVSVEIPKL